MNYWDTSALVETISDPGLKNRLMNDGGYTRTHTLTEMFSALSGGNFHIRIPANEAAKAVRAAASYLDEQEILDALDNAQSLGVRGGRVHDYMHALAANKSKADALLTTDQNDFNGLIPGLAIEQV